MMKNQLTLANDLGMKVTFCPIGAAILDILLTLSSGKQRIVTIRPKKVDDKSFLDHYFGKTIGRSAGRIKDGLFTINGHQYQIKGIAHKHGLHGGEQSLAFARFNDQSFEDVNGKGIVFSYLSPYYESGFPGNMNVIVTYYLYKRHNKLEIHYYAKSDADTLCNLTNHAYFNLNGKGTILNHKLFIDSSFYGEINHEIVPVRISPVNECMNFRKEKRIGSQIMDQTLIARANGYDHPYLLDRVSLEKRAISLINEAEDVRLNIFTSYPCVVFYSGNFPTSTIMNNGHHLKKYECLALEPQYLPNAINQSFGQEKTGLLKAGVDYHETIFYEFITK